MRVEHDVIALHVAIDPEHDQEPAEQATEVVDVLESLREHELADTDVRVSIHGYGYGADITAAAIVLGGISLFLAGERIEKNWDAWVRVGRRLRAAIGSMKATKLRVSLSQGAAEAIALAEVSDDGGAQSAPRILQTTEHPVRNASLTPAAAASFVEHPDRYYVISVEASSTLTRVIVMTATGKLLADTPLPQDHRDYLRLDDV